MKALLFVPTYNERDTAPKLCEELLKLSLPIDILFIDDNSPDGTGKLLDKIAETHPNIRVVHREGKQGIGSAHVFGINWAYDNGYEIVMSMDADFTHRPNILKN